MSVLPPGRATTLRPARLRVGLSLFVLVGLLAGLGRLDASALPPATDAPDDTLMVSGPSPVRIRSIAVDPSSGNIWVGGRFTRVVDRSGVFVRRVENLLVLDPRGREIVATPSATGDQAEVFDIDAHRGLMFVAGRFDASGGHRANLFAARGDTGVVIDGFRPRTGVLRSVLATDRDVYGGGRQLTSFDPSTGDTRFVGSSLGVDDEASDRDKGILPVYRDLAASADGSLLFAACQCDYADGDPSKAVKTLVRLDPDDGRIDHSWKPDRLGSSDVSSFGLGLIVVGDRVTVAAGGSDFVASYTVGTGSRVWRTDTSGSAQAISLSGSEAIVGGHFQWVADTRGEQCGSNARPNTACWRQPRLFALDVVTGSPVKEWTPDVCCNYNGIWAVAPESSDAVLLGGEFTTLNGVRQLHFGRLGDPPPGRPEIASVSPARGPVGTVVSISGVGFAGADRVTFNGEPARSFSIVDDGRLKATVPERATSGPISVESPLGVGMSADPFKVLRPPVIRSFDPRKGWVGTRVRVVGARFRNVSRVRLAGQPVAFEVLDATRLRFRVPSGAESGKISVKTRGGLDRSEQRFRVR